MRAVREGLAPAVAVVSAHPRQLLVVSQVLLVVVLHMLLLRKRATAVTTTAVSLTSTPSSLAPSAPCYPRETTAVAVVAAAVVLILRGPLARATSSRSSPSESRRRLLTTLISQPWGSLRSSCVSVCLMALSDCSTDLVFSDCFSVRPNTANVLKKKDLYFISIAEIGICNRFTDLTKFTHFVSLTFDNLEELNRHANTDIESLDVNDALS